MIRRSTLVLLVLIQKKMSFLLFNRLICDDNEMPFFEFLTAGEVLGTGVIFLFGENKNQAQAKETVIDLVLRYRLVLFFVGSFYYNFILPQVSNFHK